MNITVYELVFLCSKTNQMRMYDTFLTLMKFPEKNMGNMLFLHLDQRKVNGVKNAKKILSTLQCKKVKPALDRKTVTLQGLGPAVMAPRLR